MSQTNDCIRAALGSEGQVNDLLLDYYQAGGAISGQLNDAEYEYLIAQGATPAHVNDMWFELLTGLGFEGTLSDMLNAYWCGGAVIPYFMFNGDGYIDCPPTIDWSKPNRLEYIIQPGPALDANRDIWSTLDNANFARSRAITINWRSVRGGGGANVNSVVMTEGSTFRIEEGCNPVEAVNIVSIDLNTSDVDSGQAFPVLPGALTAGFRIGGNLGTSLYIGMIREFRIFDDANVLIHHWPINEGQGTVINDIVGGAHGTLVPGTGIWIP